MICPSCGRIIAEGEICPCKIDEIRNVDLQLQLERKIEEARAAQEKADVKNSRSKNTAKSIKVMDSHLNTIADKAGVLVDIVAEAFTDPANAAAQMANDSRWGHAMAMLGLEAVCVFVTITALKSSASSILFGLDSAAFFPRLVLSLLIAFIPYAAASKLYSILYRNRRYTTKQALSIFTLRSVSTSASLLLAMPLFALHLFWAGWIVVALGVALSCFFSWKASRTFGDSENQAITHGVLFTAVQAAAGLLTAAAAGTIF